MVQQGNRVGRGTIAARMKIIEYTPGITLIDLEPVTPYLAGYLGVYVLRGEKVAIIDPGPAAYLEDLCRGLEEIGVRPQKVEYILASHIHLDHTGGAGAALKRMPQAKLIVHEKGKWHLNDPSRLWQATLTATPELIPHYGEPQPVPEDSMIGAREGMEIDLGGMKIEVLLAPGHATHGLCFFYRASRSLFEGEALGVYIPELDTTRLSAPPPFHWKDYLNTLDSLLTLNPDTVYYSHLGRADNAVDRLCKHREQSLLWGRLISENMDKEWQDILEILRNEDEWVNSIEAFPQGRQQRETVAVRTGIQGYLDYFKRFGTGDL